MPQPDRKTPQLVMMRKLDDLPEVELPEGYELRSFQPGDERTWERIIAEAFDRDVPRGQFGTRIADREAFQPERVLFMCHNGEPVATASAWHVEKYGPETGYVHMVGALPGHQGKGLGYQVSLAALHRMAEERLRRAALQTDDFRLAAVKTYLKLGFEPVLVDENQRQRWAEVLRALGLPDAGRRFQQILTGPVMEYPE